MASFSNRFRRVLLWVAILFAPMVLVGWTVRARYPADWRPVEAAVGSSRIESVRYGTLEWALRVDTTYEVSGRRYATTKDAFRNKDRAAVEAEAGNWPVGRTMPLYYDAANPASTSLVADGGREATVAAAVLLTPLAVFLIGFVVFVLRRRRSRHLDKPTLVLTLFATATLATGSIVGETKRAKERSKMSKQAGP